MLAQQVLKDYIIAEQLVSVKDRDAISISVMISDAPRRADLLSKGYVLSKDHKPILNVHFLPKSWRFPPEDIMKARSSFSGLKSFRVPKLFGHFSSDAGYFFVEEYIQDAISMDLLIERGEIHHQQAREIIKDILSEIWMTAEPADEQFIGEEKANYRRYLRALIGEGYLYEIAVESLENLIDDHAIRLRKAWTTGDLRDRNILLSDGHWYLIDFEYSHRTLFLFKEVRRNIHYSSWAKNLSIHEIFPLLDNFPVEAAELLFLAWENYLYSETLDRSSCKRFQGNAIELSWDLLSPLVSHNREKFEAEIDILRKGSNGVKAPSEEKLPIPFGPFRRKISNVISRLLRG